MGGVLLKMTRYSTVMLLATGLPMMVAGYVLLRVWVGANYAVHSIEFLQVLLLANIIRNLGAPYATMIVATSRQHVATVTAVTEAVVNVACSIWFAKYYGAIGVAMGTLVGAVVGLAAHFGVSMHYTRKNFAVTRGDLFLKGIMSPAIVAIPSLICFRLWWTAGPPSLSPIEWLAWACSTLALVWFGGLNSEERTVLLGLPRNLSRSIAN
jgi:O-antigen/teichoic acid export membrane protein